MGRSASRPRAAAMAAASMIGLLASLDVAAAFSPGPNGRISSRCTPSVAPSRIRRHDSAIYHSRDEEPSPLSSVGGIVPWLQRELGSIGTAFAVFAAVLTSPINVNLHVDPHYNNLPTISIERMQANALTENQQFVADVWFAVTAQYFDPTYHGLGDDGWRAKEKEAMAAVADTGPDDDVIVEKAIGTMLAALDDPYTRYLPREKYEALTAYATARSTAGIGVQLLEDPRTKHVVVMATTADGPAARAGVRAGDVILKIDGENMEGASAEVVAAKCKGDPGKKVDVDYLRLSEDGKQKDAREHVTLTRATINANPIQASTYTSDGGKKVGVLKVPSFSTETVSQMVDGLRSVAGDDGKVDAIAIDLRGNVGGYMPAGVDAAKLFLPARSHIIAEVGRSGSSVKTYDADGIGAETTVPVYLLVDQRTASASEIFAAALQDNRRAVVVGATNTFGKGRIQNVQALGNGGGVAVTRARYVTPRGRDVHGVGIRPDRTPSECGAGDAARTCLSDVVD